MADANGHRRIHFDPTINLGHVLTAAAFLTTALVAWATLDARVAQLEADAKRHGDAFVAVENRMITRIHEERARIDQTQVRTADDIREIKMIVREGFRDLDQKLDKKVDKPNR